MRIILAKIDENQRKSTKIKENHRESTKINENQRKSKPATLIFIDVH